MSLIGSGRTDSGVHAKGQIANVHFNTKMSPSQIKNALNAKLLSDIFIVDCTSVNQDFNARFSAKEREYIYYITRDYSPINRLYSWHCKWNFNQDRLDKCSEILIGQNDFSLFSKASSETKNKICCIYESNWIHSDKFSTYTILGDRFLQHMVRLLVGTMVEVARDRLSIEDFKNILKCKNTNFSAVRAPASGLFLNKISYD